MDGSGVSSRGDDDAPILLTTPQSGAEGGSGGSALRRRGVRLLSYLIGLDGPVERDVGVLLAQYALWASCMLVLNKAAVGSVSLDPTVLLLVQLVFACAAVPVMQVAMPVARGALPGGGLLQSLTYMNEPHTNLLPAKVQTYHLFLSLNNLIRCVCVCLRRMRECVPLLEATLPTQFAERLGLHDKGGGSVSGGGVGGGGIGGGGGGGAGEVVVVRYFPGITASLHWLVTGVGFLLSIWCSISTLKHGDVSWYMVLHQVIPVGVCLVDWKFLGHDPPTPLAFGGVAFCLSWALAVMAWRTGSVVPEMEAGMWGLAWLATMTCYLPMLKRTCMMHKATALERVFYSNFAALVVLCMVGTFYYTTRAKDWGGEMAMGTTTTGFGDGFGGGGGGSSGGVEEGGVVVVVKKMSSTLGVGGGGGGGGVEWMAWVYVVVALSSMVGVALSHVRMNLLTHITATSYASFGVTALFPVRVWQSFSRVG